METGLMAGLVEIPRVAPVLNTKRLTLRPLEDGDVNDIFSIHSDEEVMRYWSGTPISRLEEARDIIRKNFEWASQGDSISWGVVHTESGRLVGTCTLFKIDRENQHAEVGFILNRQWWRQGVMSEAVTKMVAYAFDQLTMHRLEADVDPENAGSLALLKNLGFREEGFFRERWDVGGEWKDSVMLGLLASEHHRQ
jgi:RimJ/RimL family protein N-acetyltransferase